LLLTRAVRVRYDRARSEMVFHSNAEVTAMTWEAPDFIEVKMDAEINSYQDDFEREQDDRF
jgi:coenzyme PQQ precursor peptide PqqA